MRFTQISWILSFIIFLNVAMEAPQPSQDANGYRYRDESTVQDKRKIAILSFGSLVRQNTNNQTGAKLEASAFAPTAIQLPVSISRLSQGNRMTAVIDKNGDPKRVWAATSHFQFLPNTRNNVAAREGSPYRSQDSGYDLTNIFYMKKLAPDRMKDPNEEAIAGSDRWVIRTEANERQRIPAAAALALAQWADANGYSAIVWASFPPNLSSQQATAAKLLENAELLRNTQDYVRNLPDGAQSAFEQAIIIGPDALRAFTVATPAAVPVQLAPVSRPAPAAAAPAAQPRPAAAAPADHERHYENFTFFQRGDLPILLSAPHGGTKAIPGVPERVGGINPLTGRRVNLFVTVWDDGTLELAQQASDEIYRLLGARPYLVAADFTRKQVDANRPAEDAYESNAAKKIYDQYHGKMRAYVDEIRNRFGTHAILVDIHGQGVDANTIYRGTNNRKNVTRLVNRNGEAALTGPESILGILSQKGYSIFPRNNEPQTPEKSIFSGGFIVRNYGSNNANGIDAIQLENGWALRRGQGVARFARDLANAIAGFYGEYLLQ